MLKFPFRHDPSTVWPPPPTGNNSDHEYEGEYPKIRFSFEGMAVFSLTYMLLSNLIYLPFGFGTLLSAVLATELYSFLPGLAFAGIQFLCLKLIYQWCHRRKLTLISCVLLTSSVGAIIEVSLLILSFNFLMPALLSIMGWTQTDRKGAVPTWEQLSLLLFFVLLFVNAVVSGSISGLLWLGSRKDSSIQPNN